MLFVLLTIYTVTIAYVMKESSPMFLTVYCNVIEWLPVSGSQCSITRRDLRVWLANNNQRDIYLCDWTQNYNTGRWDVHAGFLAGLSRQWQRVAVMLAVNKWRSERLSQRSTVKTRRRWSECSPVSPCLHAVLSALRAANNMSVFSAPKWSTVQWKATARTPSSFGC